MTSSGRNVAEKRAGVGVGRPVQRKGVVQEDRAQLLLERCGRRRAALERVDQVRAGEDAEDLAPAGSANAARDRLGRVVGKPLCLFRRRRHGHNAHAAIRLRLERPTSDGKHAVGEMIDTTVGRVLFNEIVPVQSGFINELLTKKNMRPIIGHVFKTSDFPSTARFLDEIKNLGFERAMRGGQLRFGQ